MDQRVVEPKEGTLERKLGGGSIDGEGRRVEGRGS